ncbi:MAG: hypothetical protein C0621_09930 [Desulfuromonas sp.]|nr:MAG: hypothetical protein C0621_09930 [Desulfuromonas sp.]
MGFIKLLSVVIIFFSLITSGFADQKYFESSVSRNCKISQEKYFIKNHHRGSGLRPFGAKCSENLDCMSNYCIDEYPYDGVEQKRCLVNPLGLNVVLGPIIGAEITVSPLYSHDEVILSGTTQDDEDLDRAGWVQWDQYEMPEGYNETPLYLVVTGGVDIDANDDRVRDPVPTPNDIRLEFVLPTTDELSDLQIIANPLLEYANRYVFINTYNETERTPEEIRTILRRIAKSLIREDVDGDGEIGWKDILRFHPLADQNKTRVPWDKVIDDIYRRRNNYFAEFAVRYANRDIIDKSSLKPLGYNSDETFNDNTSSTFWLLFSTNKNGYDLCDLYESQGLLGGSVILPDSYKISYSNSEGVYYDIGTPPLYTQIMPSEEKNTCFDCIANAAVGGDIIDPKVAPPGPYEIYYSTVDGLSHSETMYVYENSNVNDYYVWPKVEVDENGFLDSISWQFEDNNGIQLDDPPVLIANQYVTPIFGSIKKLNTILHEPGYYIIDEKSPFYLFDGSLNLTDLSSVENLYNAEKKIYYEDIGQIGIVIENGDGTSRQYDFTVQAGDYSPVRVDSYFENNKFYVNYIPAPQTGTAIQKVKYRIASEFGIFNDPWIEIDGDSAVIDIQKGSYSIWTAAKDSTGFYSVPVMYEFPK